MGATSWTCGLIPNNVPGFTRQQLAIMNDERVRPTDDTSGKSIGVAGEGDGVMMNVVSGRDDDGSSSATRRWW